MRKINKSHEPNGLCFHRSQPHADYDNIPPETKTDLKRSLLMEQGYLCCYCMDRVDITTMRIEHWQCQSRFSPRALDYTNLMAACSGNEGSSEREHHCDVQKKDSDLCLNPSNALDHDRLSIRYL